jgi:hypothetical protein
MENTLALWGTVQPPPGVVNYDGGNITGLQKLVSNGVQTLIVIAGIYAFFNLIFAGYAFMSAGGDPEKIAHAWAKIWQTLLGLVIAAGSFVLAGVFGQLIFGARRATELHTLI